MGSEKHIGRFLERFKGDVDALNLGTAETVEKLHTFLDCVLKSCGYQCREYDTWARAYHKGEEPRREPIVLAKWRNADPDTLKKLSPIIGCVKRAAGNISFLKFDKKLDHIKPGELIGLSIIVRGNEKARSIIAAVFKESGCFSDLDEFEDRNQHSHDPNTKSYSFAGRISININ